MFGGYFDVLPPGLHQTQTHACNCVGPQNGAPACPCMMPEHNRRKMADMALEILTRHKPRIRVPAGRREVA